MELGYERVSTTKQDLERQIEALAETGIDRERIYVDKKSGGRSTGRDSRRCSATRARAMWSSCTRLTGSSSSRLACCASTAAHMASPMAQLRSFTDQLREQFGVPYPLAHHRPFVGTDRQLVLRAQEAAGLDGEYCLVAIASGQLVLTYPAEAFVERVTWDHDVAVAWRPHDDERSPVRMNPELRFGRPAIKGISTEVLWEHAESGEDVEETAEAFDIEPDDCAGLSPTRRRCARRETVGQAGDRPFLLRC